MTINPPLSISSTTPLDVVSSQPILVLGSGFNPDMVATLDGNALSPMSITPTEFSFALPTGTDACNATLTLTNPCGLGASIQLIPPPIITSLSYDTGPAAGGGAIIIWGSGFGQNALAQVTFGNSQALVLGATANFVAAIVPAGVPGPVTVAVTPGSGCTLPATTTFTYF
ncbi:MAG: IPT/TIG domain-containing protein [Planctomycetota bacterium]